MLSLSILIITLELIISSNGVSSVFSRIRLMYGSTPLEDIINSNVIMRMLNESTASSDQILDQASISDGLGGSLGGTGFTTFRKNIRQRYIQGVSESPVLATPDSWDECGRIKTDCRSSVC